MSVQCGLMNNFEKLFRDRVEFLTRDIVAISILLILCLSLVILFLKYPCRLKLNSSINYPHMDEHLESLRIENKKLRGRHNELESNLTEEKEMVKYLHGVIKNYQKLLRKPETARHLKTASLRKSPRSTSDRRLASESDAEEFFVKKLVEMSSDCVKDKDSEAKRLQPPSAFSANDDKHTEVVDATNCKNVDRTNINRQDRVDENLSSETIVEDELTPHSDATFQNVKGNESESSRRNLDFSSVSEPQAEKVTDPRSKQETENILQEMTRMLDSMMEKAIMHENTLKQKDKHLKRMERRYEYLASIALGEESEWL